jgi:hypothetical protein
MFVLMLYRDMDAVMVIGPFEDEADAWTYHEQNVQGEGYVDVMKMLSPAEIEHRT